MFQQKAFWKHLGQEGGKEEGADNTLFEQTLSRTGAYIMSKRMFDEGEVNWPEDLYKAPVYVVTHEKREPWVQKGSTVFYFVNDGHWLDINTAVHDLDLLSISFSDPHKCSLKQIFEVPICELKPSSTSSRQVFEDGKSILLSRSGRLSL